MKDDFAIATRVYRKDGKEWYLVNESGYETEEAAEDALELYGVGSYMFEVINLNEFKLEYVEDPIQGTITYAKIWR